jgi:hypothetical protein
MRPDWMRNSLVCFVDFESHPDFNSDLLFLLICNAYFSSTKIISSWIFASQTSTTQHDKLLLRISSAQTPGHRNSRHLHLQTTWRLTKRRESFPYNPSACLNLFADANRNLADILMHRGS